MNSDKGKNKGNPLPLKAKVRAKSGSDLVFLWCALQDSNLRPSDS